MKQLLIICLLLVAITGDAQKHKKKVKHTGFLDIPHDPISWIDGVVDDGGGQKIKEDTKWYPFGGAQVDFTDTTIYVTGHNKTYDIPPAGIGTDDTCGCDKYGQVYISNFNAHSSGGKLTYTPLPNIYPSGGNIVHADLSTYNMVGGGAIYNLLGIQLNPPASKTYDFIWPEKLNNDTTYNTITIGGSMRKIAHWKGNVSTTKWTLLSIKDGYYKYKRAFIYECFDKVDDSHFFSCASAHYDWQERLTNFLLPGCNAQDTIAQPIHSLDMSTGEKTIEYWVGGFGLGERVRVEADKEITIKQRK